MLSASVPSSQEEPVEKKRLAVFVPQVDEFKQLISYQK
jgi:hypothetical protein